MEPLYKLYSAISYNDAGLPDKFSLHCPDNFNFAFDVLDVIAEKEPDKRALVWCSAPAGSGKASLPDMGTEREFTFRALSVLSSKAANLFKRQGIGKGSRVMLLMKRHYAYWYTINALHKLGAVAIPATHMLTVKDIRYRIRMAGIDTAVCVGEPDLCRRVREAFAAEGKTLPLFCVGAGDALPDGFQALDKALKPMPETVERPETTLTDPMLLYFTSGTTGEPKAVIHGFSYPLYHISTALFWHGCTPDGLHLSVAETGWAKAAWGKLYGQWLCGCALMVYDCQNLFVGELLSVLEKYGVRTFCAPPTVYRNMVKTGFRAEAFAGVRRCTTAGEDIKASVAETFTEKTGLPVYPGYGQTETALLCANLDSPDSDCLGSAMPLYELLLIDEEGNPITEGMGELVVRRKDPVFSGVCISYISEDGSLRDPFDEKGYFHTGDIAKLNEKGKYVFVGRTDDMIKSAGFRVSPQEVENMLMRHEDIADCAVIGVPDSLRGVLIKAFVVLKPGIPADETTRAEILRYAKENTAGYKRPRAIEFRDALPKTISDKLRRSVLKAESKKEA